MFIAPPTRYIFIHSCLLRFLWFDPLGESGSAWGDWANYTDSPLRAFENETGVAWTGTVSWIQRWKDVEFLWVSWIMVKLLGFNREIMVISWNMNRGFMGFFQQLLDEIGVYIQIGSYWENGDNQSMFIWNISIMLGWTQTIYHVFTMVHMFVYLTIEPFGENNIQNLSINNGQNMGIWPPNLWYIYIYNVPLVHHLI